MIIIDESFSLREPVILSIGKFDGDHIGHQKIFRKMRELSLEKGLKTLVFTSSNFSSLENSKKINSKLEKYKRLENENIDYLAEYEFDENLKNMDAIDFLKEILIKKLKMKVLVAGEDLSFGQGKRGNVELVSSLAKELDIELYVIKKERTADNEEISSSLIKRLISSGNIKEANELMGYTYNMSGVVESGNKIGKKLFDFPTANIIPSNEKVLPLLGVYKTSVELIDTGLKLPSITNIGTNPSIKDDKKNHTLRIETHIFGLNEEIYGKKIKIYFEDFIREQKKFDSIEDLKKQIEKDIKKVQGDYDEN